MRHLELVALGHRIRPQRSLLVHVDAEDQLFAGIEARKLYDQ